MPFDFDLITLGAGSGGVAASRRAAAHGARVAIVEGSRVGGTCVIRGCVPKKLLMYAAQLGDALREAPHYGWSPAGSGFDMARWAAAKAAGTARLEGVYRQLLEDAKVELVYVNAEELEGPIAEFLPRFTAALESTEPLDANERRARAGLVARQVTLR